MIEDSYQTRFQETLKSARLDQVDERLTPEEFPGEAFGVIGVGVRIAWPSETFWRSRDWQTMTANEVDGWLRTEEVTRHRYEPATLADGLDFCSKHDLNYDFFDFTTVLVWGSRSRTKQLMPSFRLRLHDEQLVRCAELFHGYNKTDRYAMDVAFLLRQKL